MLQRELEAASDVVMSENGRTFYYNDLVDVQGQICSEKREMIAVSFSSVLNHI